MVRMADMWMAPVCLRECFTALVQHVDACKTLDQLTDIFNILPDSVLTLAEYAAWEQQWQTQVVIMFEDVHTLLTSHDQLQRFRQLPFQALRAWAASDKLVVDSENSVAVAISWWYGGEQGSGSSKWQLKQLSRLLRVGQLTHGKKRPPC
jgi:hypothetical protein